MKEITNLEIGSLRVVEDTVFQNCTIGRLVCFADTKVILKDCEIKHVTGFGDLQISKTNIMDLGDSIHVIEMDSCSCVSINGHATIDRLSNCSVQNIQEKVTVKLVTDCIIGSISGIVRVVNVERSSVADFCGHSLINKIKESSVGVVGADAKIMVASDTSFKHVEDRKRIKALVAASA